ncbi:FG-GAP repeat-containing protein [Halovenus aranensis]|uniref:FG-GAP repeat-containing protein n=1 Tax=Halovenus aranensis TaxID=890420 RepID=A0A1G8X558_9EURY|nr:FG-GAP repeat protein [Halovenus aranensis]SDJ85497.1 FG-GAP repeat-containing protein [Halovenus aranensis]
MQRTRRQLLATAGTISIASLAGCRDDDETEANGETGVDGEDTAKTANGTDDGDGPTLVQPLQQQAKLSPDDEEEDFFGHEVAVSADGTTAVVGAVGDDTGDGSDAGSLSVFSRDEGGWQQQARLVAGDGEENDELGDAVSLSADGTSVVAGATGSDRNGQNAGAAYVFTQTEEGWERQTALVPDDGDENDRFGASAAVSNDGTTAVVGASLDDDPNGTEGGSAYVFSRVDGSWQQQARLAPADGDTAENFGRSVALSGDGKNAVVGCPGDGSQESPLRGSAYVFARADGEWQQQTALLADDGDTGDELGYSVAVSGDGTTAVVGARREEEPNGQNAGAAYVFTRGGDDWQQQTKLTASNGEPGDFFGGAVTVSDGGETAVVGATLGSDVRGVTGAAFLFSRVGESWQQQAALSPAEGNASDAFGEAVAVSADSETAVVGAPGRNVPSGEPAGSVYVFA